MKRSADAGAKGDVHTGHEGLDREHVVQVGLVDALVDAVEQRQDPSLIRSILDQLLEYTRVHFLSEQLLMRLHAYPAYGRHLSEHENMTERLFELSELQRTGERVDTNETLRQLRAELIEHIQTRDLELSNYLQRSSLEAGGS
jgi:hemerythrin